MNFSRRNFLSGAAFGGAALAMSGDIVMAEMPLGQLPAAHTTGQLPGKPLLYALRNGEGEFHFGGGQVATLIARRQETNGEFTAAILTGSIGAGLPMHRHRDSDEAFLVLDGRVELHLDGKAHLLTAGDYAYIPAGAAHGYRMMSWRTRILTYSIGDKLDRLYQALGEPFSRPVQPETATSNIDEEKLKLAMEVADVAFLGSLPPDAEPVLVTNKTIPSARQPYVLQAGEGERLVAADQLFSFLQTSASTDDRFFAVMTEGPAGRPIPWHYHQHHTENFFCVDGLMTMWVNGEEVHLYPGDYLQVPPNTVHSYRLDAPYTRFFGWLVPAVFEPFFRYVGDPYEGHVFPVEPPPFRFDRVLAHLAELDLNVVAIKN